MSSKCDIINDTSNAMSCGLCTSKTRPLGCGNISKAVCSVPGAANAKMQLFALEHKFNRTDILLPEEKIYNMKVQSSKEALAKAYPAVKDVDISWPDFELCQNANAGTRDVQYFNRVDLAEMGMDPVYPIGGKTAGNLFWKDDKSPIPVFIDYIMNPQLFVIVIFIFLVLVYTIMILSVRYRGRLARAAVAK
jgi:hypothetical protein